MKSEKLVSDNGKIIVRDELMIGQQYAFEMHNFIIVSPAMFELLKDKDEQIRLSVMEQVKVYDLKKVVQREVDNLTENELTNGERIKEEV